jgi:hypothetical protein
MIAKHPGCKSHAFQDAEYGVGFRVMNPSSPKDRLLKYRCTVCAPKKVLSQHRGGEYELSQLSVLRK